MLSEGKHKGGARANREQRHPHQGMQPDRAERIMRDTIHRSQPETLPDQPDQPAVCIQGLPQESRSAPWFNPPGNMSDRKLGLMLAMTVVLSVLTNIWFPLKREEMLQSEVNSQQLEIIYVKTNLWASGPFINRPSKMPPTLTGKQL